MNGQHRCIMPRTRTHGKNGRKASFAPETLLISLISVKHYDDYNRWIASLSPFLRRPPRNKAEVRLLTRLDFDFSKDFPKTNIYRETAEFMAKGKVLRVDKKTFYRYLCSADHGNIGIKAQSMESYVNLILTCKL